MKKKTYANEHYAAGMTVRDGSITGKVIFVSRNKIKVDAGDAVITYGDIKFPEFLSKLIVL